MNQVSAAPQSPSLLMTDSCHTDVKYGMHRDGELSDDWWKLLIYANPSPNLCTSKGVLRRIHLRASNSHQSNTPSIPIELIYILSTVPIYSVNYGLSHTSLYPREPEPTWSQPQRERYM